MFTGPSRRGWWMEGSALREHHW